MAEGKKAKVKEGTMKPSTRKGKRAMVYMGGKWHHFGSKNMSVNGSKEQAEAARARHRSALSGSDPRAKAYRKYWNKYWSKAKV